MTNLGIAQALAFEPRKAFVEIGERPRYWFPLLVLVIATTGISMWYLSVVDLSWMMDQQLRSNASITSRLNDQQITELVKAAADRRVLQIVVTGIFTPIVLGLAFMFAALLSLLTAKVTNVQYGYRHWFSLACWASLPTVLASIASALVLATASSAQISQADLQPLSFNSLIFHRESGTPGYAVLSYVHVLYLWSMFLSVFAVKVWSRRSWLFSFLFAMWPTLLVGAIWAAFALR
jgi:hypothetical protein